MKIKWRKMYTPVEPMNVYLADHVEDPPSTPLERELEWFIWTDRIWTDRSLDCEYQTWIVAIDEEGDAYTLCLDR